MKQNAQLKVTVKIKQEVTITRETHKQTGKLKTEKYRETEKPTTECFKNLNP